MENYGTAKFVDKKLILRLKDRVCETPGELLSSSLFLDVVKRYMKDLIRKESKLLAVFGKEINDIEDCDLDKLIGVFQVLEKMELENLPKLIDGVDSFIEDPSLLQEFVEGLYNYWRTFERYVICDSSEYSLDTRPYRTFDSTIETLMHLVRQTYRDMEENITGRHPNIFRQVAAGGELGVITIKKELNSIYAPKYKQLDKIPIIRQMLLYPPLLLDPPMNKRAGKFEEIYKNPMDIVDINTRDWLCYPAKVGSLLIMVYVHERFFELGFSLCNLFELAEDEFLDKKPDAIYLYGTPSGSLDGLANMPTVFYEDKENDLLIGAVPNDDIYGYFGYLKKMILTLHNIKVMKQGKMPFHGALVNIVGKNDKSKTVLIIGESGTGKSESLEALRIIGEEQIKEMIIIADDMGSIDLNEDGEVVGFGTETGAFVRLDDLQPGYAFGQIDRSIIMSPNKVNSRIILPVTTYEEVIKGYKIDMVLYANNYETVDEDHPIISKISTAERALEIFRDGTAMSKGTTTSTGLIHSYFANIFGPIQKRDLHEKISKGFFEKLYQKAIFVGQFRTRLGVTGYEQSGPEEAAQALLELL
ncbi:MAG: phosphoenolpyruvate carboxykinase [Candidatus Neomarinimicrobiota bacterium]